MQRYVYFANVVCLFVAKSSLFASFSWFAYDEFPEIEFPKGCRGLDGLRGETLVAISVDGCHCVVQLSSAMLHRDAIAALAGADEVAVVVDVDGVVGRGIYII